MARIKFPIPYPIPWDWIITPLEVEIELAGINRFTCVEFDEEAALDNARRRHDALAKFGAPEEIVAIYKNPKVVRVRITNPELDGYNIEFDLWHKQGVMVYARPDEGKLRECEQLARKLASVLSYDCTIEEYD